MNPAKLRRSRDVSELDGSKTEKRFRIRDLAMSNMVFYVGYDGKESARQAADSIAKMLICGGLRRTGRLHISSGRHSTAYPVIGISTL
jgi:hypothetical protein